MINDEKFIDIAIELSKKEFYPYGAIIVKDGQIIGRSDVNVPVSKTAYSHAELRAIENAMEHLGGHLCAEGGKGCTIYSSCEPCAMCMGAILYTGIENISNRLEDEGDMPLTLEGLLKDYKDHYGWRKIN